MGNISKLLKEAYSSIPHEFAYREVRFYLYHAMQKLENVEKKQSNREKQALEQKIVRENLEQEAKKRNIPTYQNNAFLKTKIDIIDKMIEEEYKKIENIKNKLNEPIKYTDGESQAIHG